MFPSAVYCFCRVDVCLYPSQSDDHSDISSRFYERKKDRDVSRILLRYDVFWGETLGFYALILTVIGYLNGSFKRLFYDEDIKLPLVLIAGSELVYGLVIYICFFMMQGDFHFFYYLIHLIMPELVYTILVTIVLYQILLYMNRKLEAEEQRSASKFV